ncbi:hypothetical protein ACH95_15530 [Bacillus glycinifermentans]|uniref:hypothetical protein n=1 Tax=Bacillus glycinifermentans TaxID=1664069 RepID=UPI000653FB92|nr:hypothetical protein [Bacillus glycinifermentans]KMM57581.1 hypothetical protein ACH95_15530 [Bacillus glycinifermentans]MEC0496608.1 hypothetical protein [Bacillus glycinifermentans]MEC0542404.1 hypothetical protein [Bacillus glycinifermentans]
MTKDQLEAIRKRAEAATEGEWCEGYDHYVLIDNFKGSYQTFGVARCARKEDTEFIAHARQDIPALLDHIAELASDIARMCPIADRPIVESLLAEKDHMAEEISDLRRKIDLYESYAQEYDYYAILNEMGDEDDDDR